MFFLGKNKIVIAGLLCNGFDTRQVSRIIGITGEEGKKRRWLERKRDLTISFDEICQIDGGLWHLRVRSEMELFFL